MGNHRTPVEKDFAFSVGRNFTNLGLDLEQIDICVSDWTNPIPVDDWELKTRPRLTPTDGGSNSVETNGA